MTEAQQELLFGLAADQADGTSREGAPPMTSEARIEALAGIIAGFTWPGARSFQSLPKAKQQVARMAARMALDDVRKFGDAY